MTRRFATWCFVLVSGAAFAVISQCDPLQSTCEQKCYAQKSTEPRDFDDCIRRCQK